MTDRDLSPVEQAAMPVFTIKAKDNLAPDAVAHYQGLCTGAGLSVQAHQVAKAWAEIMRWRELHPDQCKDPDHPHVPAGLAHRPSVDAEAVERAAYAIIAAEGHCVPVEEPDHEETLKEAARLVYAVLSAVEQKEE